LRAVNRGISAAERVQVFLSARLTYPHAGRDFLCAQTGGYEEQGLALS
jgi:hypothetical protein